MAFAMIGRCFAAIALSGTIQMTYEVFPTVVRVRGVAVASAAGMTASFLAPFIIHSVREQTTQGVHPGPGVCSLDGQSRIIREFRAVPKWLLSLSTSFRLHLHTVLAEENWLRST